MGLFAPRTSHLTQVDKLKNFFTNTKTAKLVRGKKRPGGITSVVKLLKGNADDYSLRVVMGIVRTRLNATSKKLNGIFGELRNPSLERFAYPGLNLDPGIVH